MECNCKHNNNSKCDKFQCIDENCFPEWAYTPKDYKKDWDNYFGNYGIVVQKQHPIEYGNIVSRKTKKLLRS